MKTFPVTVTLTALLTVASAATAVVETPSDQPQGMDDWMLKKPYRSNID